MFLRSLTLRGFKSFADKTVIDVEPGITVIVGPNGSGKSNVVDALAWVLGTHSAKKVRGGSMSDVIFAGSPSRNRAGQARVEIMIDNEDGQLAGSVGTAASAGEFSEIRIARTIQHDGEADYEINGSEVRALDVQELLSDTGLGRELHTIVSQGQLDEILNARPEERRRYIEEAAGILKHRRRRERALRKLEQVDAHVEKLRTVLRELRRQLRPLERQAEAADRHAALQDELREVRTQLAARQLARLTARRLDEQRGGNDVAARLADLDHRIEATAGELADLERGVADAGSAAETATGQLHALASLAERVRGTADLVEARRRHLVEYVEEPLVGRPPGELRAHAERVDGERAQRESAREADRQRFDEAVAARREAEAARREHEQALQAERRRRAERRERVLRWEGEVSALHGAIASSEAELGRVSSALISLDARIAEARREADDVEAEIQTLDAREVDLTASLEDAEERVATRDEDLERARERIRALEGERASLAARAEGLRAALADAGAGTAALLGEERDGILGRVADLVRVAPEATAAVASALGHLGEAVAVATPEHARDAVAWLRRADAGSAVVLAPARLAEVAPVADPSTVDRLAAAGARPLADMVTAASGREEATEVVAALGRWLAGSFLVDDWASAVELHGREPAWTFVTVEGDVAGPAGYRAGGSAERSAVVTATAAEAAEARVAEIDEELVALRAVESAAEEGLAAARDVLAAATDRINESDARITGAAERLARLHKELHSLTTQREIVVAQQAELEQVLERDRATLSDTHARGPDVDDEEPPVGDGEIDQVAVELDEAVERAREVELQARVALERTTEQVRHLELQADNLRREAEEVEAAVADAARRRAARRRGIERCGQLAVVARALIEAVEHAANEARAAQTERAETLTRLRTRHAGAREQERELVTERDALREEGHARDLGRAEVDSQIDALASRLASELSLTLDQVRAAHPDVDPSEDDGPLAEREDVLVRKIGLLGRVNPLALEEFRALEERHDFLAEQLDDLRRSRKDLEDVVSAVDDRIREVFREAFDDVAREFELTFATVFPGGQGRLVMTDAEDLLHAGVEVEARPPGKRITRLSLLSGGERSLTVLAFVFAIFRARPSPFYVLDEVDAALDDVNLQRLLRVVRSFKGHAQVIMVTHQKRTMEIADVLYGITMGPDGVTKVVAERFDDETARGALEERASDAPTDAEVVELEPSATAVGRGARP